MSLPVVAIVGRPNIGKSTLFNRMVSKKLAIVDNVSGVTRDRLYRECEWQGRKFLLIDTGGIVFNSEDKIKEETTFQVNLAIEESDLILFMVNVREGLTPLDMDIAIHLRQSGKPVILVVNKVEGEKCERDSFEFYQLGYEEMINVSAEHGLNTGDLMDQIISLLPEEETSGLEDVLSVAIVGRPNVGKSSLLNALLGEKRVIVDSIPGTTRDAIDTLIKRDNIYFNFIDTAGIRRKSRIYEDIEYYSILRAFRAISRSRTGILVLDAEAGISEQDKKIAGRIIKEGKSCLVVVNKWDLYLDRQRENFMSPEEGIENFDAFFKKKKKELQKDYTEMVRNKLYFVDYSPVLFISALRKWEINKVFSSIISIKEEQTRRIDTNILNQVINEAVGDRPPPGYKGKTLKIYYALQVTTNPPKIILFCNSKKLLHFSYKRYLENRLREAFGFEGTPLKIVLKEGR